MEEGRKCPFEQRGACNNGLCSGFYGDQTGNSRVTEADGTDGLWKKTPEFLIQIVQKKTGVIQIVQIPINLIFNAIFKIKQEC